MSVSVHESMFPTVVLSTKFFACGSRAAKPAQNATKT
jgi:hypothetical protein